MITDAGLDLLGGTNTGWPTCFQFARVGTNAGNLPVRRDTGVITCTQVTTVLTASAPFFSAADVGRIFKYGTNASGVEMYITGFTSSTIVSVSVSQTVAVATVGTVWYVEETALNTQILVTSTLDTTAGACQTTRVGMNIVHQRTFIFPAVGATTTFKEIGWSATSGGVLFGRDIITPGDTLTAGQQYKVIVQVIVTYAPPSPLANGNVGTLLDTTGFTALESLDINNAINVMQRVVSPNGASSAVNSLDPASPGNWQWCAITAAYAQNGAPLSTGTLITTALARQNLNPTAYAPGSFQRLYNGDPYPVTSYNGLLYGIGLISNSSGAPGAVVVDTHFTTPQPMTNAQTFTASFLYTWQRILDNA